MRKLEKKMIIIRGMPGSGKTTLAREMISEDAEHYEADMYWDGKVFNKKRIKDAHSWCYKKVCSAVERGVKKVIISNTFLQRWEAEPFLKVANDNGYFIEIITCNGKWESIHDVPHKTLESMAERMENASDW